MVSHHQGALMLEPGSLAIMPDDTIPGITGESHLLYSTTPGLSVVMMTRGDLLGGATPSLRERLSRTSLPHRQLVGGRKQASSTAKTARQPASKQCRAIPINWLVLQYCAVGYCLLSQAPSISTGRVRVQYNTVGVPVHTYSTVRHGWVQWITSRPMEEANPHSSCHYSHPPLQTCRKRGLSFQCSKLKTNLTPLLLTYLRSMYGLCLCTYFVLQYSTVRTDCRAPQLRWAARDYFVHGSSWPHIPPPPPPPSYRTQYPVPSTQTHTTSTTTSTSTTTTTTPTLMGWHFLCKDPLSPPAL